MRVLIRVDIDGAYGLGHGVRMRALAQALLSHGAEVAFTSLTPELAAFVKPFPVWAGCHWPNQATQKTEVYVVDTAASMPPGHYEEWKESGARIVRIDAPSATPDSCDLLIGPCAHWSPDTVTSLRGDFGDRFLYGWDYVMLAPEVTERPALSYGERDNSIVFCAGASDPTGALRQMWAWVESNTSLPERCFLRPAQATYVLSPGYSADVIDLTLSHRFPRRTGCYTVPFDRKYVRSAALVVSLFGVTAYECLWYRTPVLLLGDDAFDCIDAAALEKVSGGGVRGKLAMADYDAEHFSDLVRYYWWNTAKRQAMTDASAGLLDGRGTERVADAIIQLA